MNVQGSGAHRAGRGRSGAGRVSDKLQAGSWRPHRRSDNVRRRAFCGAFIGDDDGNDGGASK